MRLDHAAIAVAASVGRSRLLVYSKTEVAVLATGDEIVDIDIPSCSQPDPQFQYLFFSRANPGGGRRTVLLPIAPDEPERLSELIADGFEADLLLLTGGVSMGKYDLVEQVLAEFQSGIFLYRSTDSAGTAGRVWTGAVWRGRPRPRRGAARRRVRRVTQVLLRLAGKPGLDYGDL